MTIRPRSRGNDDYFRFMTFKCPLAGYPIDPRAARLQAVAAILLSSICLAVQNRSRIAFALVLLVDLFPRAISRPEWSFSGGIAKTILKSLGFHPRRTDASPRRFSARVATLVAGAIIVFSTMGETVQALTLSGALLVASTLDALLDFSIGCRFYEFWWSIFGRPRDPDQF